jgi:hypothetical protein
MVVNPRLQFKGEALHGVDEFWRENIQKEPSMLALMRTPEMAQLAKEYGR